MKDRYLFKAKDCNSIWRAGLLIALQEDRCAIEEKDGSKWACDSETLCQCTGLKDKNGKLIWENDVVNCLTEKCCGCIGWNESEAGFYFNVLLEDGRFEEEYIYDYQDGIEVIGNVFDDPELLESEVGNDK